MILTSIITTSVCLGFEKSRVIPQITALHIAAKNGNIDIIKAIVPYANINNQPHSNIPPPRSSKHHSAREYVTCEVGYYRQHIDRAGEPLLQENDHTRLMRKTDELRDVFEKANARVHHELRKLTMSLQSDFDEIKRKLLESQLIFPLKLFFFKSLSIVFPFM